MPKLKFSPTPIFKLSATGNDFLLIDLRRHRKWPKSRPTTARKLCHRHEGLGADGLVFIENDKLSDFQWDFYNSDGSSAEMCGNAARAAALYVATTDKKSRLKFHTEPGLVEAHVHSARKIDVRLPAIKENHWNQILNWKSGQTKFDFIRAGVPHVVLQVPNINERTPLKELALEIKRQPSFIKEGTNVTFVRIKEKHKVESITFERGVEDFTFSCGTGAVASAHSVLRGEEQTPVEVQVPGGTLSVIWKKGFPHLIGPAKIVAEMHTSVDLK